MRGGTDGHAYSAKSRIVARRGGRLPLCVAACKSDARYGVEVGVTANKKPVGGARQKGIILDLKSTCRSTCIEKLLKNGFLRGRDVFLRGCIIGCGLGVHAPAVDHFGNVAGHMSSI